MTTHLDTAALTDLGDVRVEIRGVRGSAPPATTKVAITGVGGWENSVIFALTGTDLDAKAALVERSVHRYTDAVDGLDVAIDRIGQAQHDPDSQNAGTELLRIAVQGTKETAGRAFSSRMVELALSSYPGMYSLGPPQPVQRSVSTGPHCSTKHCSSTRSTTTTARPRPSHRAGPPRVR